MVRNLLIFVVLSGLFQTIYWSCSGPRDGATALEDPVLDAESTVLEPEPLDEEIVEFPSSQEEIKETSEEGLNLPSPRPGAWNLSAYLSKIQGKRLGLVVNQTSMIGSTHLLDTLIALGMEVEVIFAPEHGFRGEQDAGQKVVDGKDPKTGLPILSLYGKNKKPSVEDLIPVDLLLFDIQDVGARFYTYLSTLHYV
ncbi:MAG: exo-beta-N-acetylmuramidase NamZ domain-containing protein, partial [Bacteroidota bacterium]